MDKKTIAGYEIRGSLGEGGMGVVYRAHDTTLDRPLAIKVIRPENLSDEAKERFLREARACSRINHPNIVTVYAAGEEDGNLYLAMELLEGRTLRDVIDEGVVPWKQAVSWIVDILGALERLHGEGIVHRDLKPENVMVSDDGTVTLMDFGIARVEKSETITVDGAMLGTASYMSPEQVLGKRADARSDIFSLACVLHQLLAGEPPFKGEHPMAIMYAISNDSPVPIPDEIARELPEELIRILDRALEKNPNARFEDSSSFKNALIGTITPEAAQATTTAAPPARGSHLRVIIPAALVIVAAAVITTILIQRRSPAGDRDQAFLYNERGQDYESEDKLIDAEIEYRKAIATDPSWERPIVNLGALRMEQGKLAEAESLFNEAIARDPLSYQAHYNLGALRWNARDGAGAETSFRAAIDADTVHVEAHSYLGHVLLALGRADEALAVLDEGLAREERHPSDTNVRGFLLKNRGRASHFLGEEEEALTYWQQAHEIIPDNIELHRFLAQAYEGRGDTDRAIEHWEIVSGSNIAAEREEAARRLKILRP